MATSQEVGVAKMSLTLDTSDYDVAVERSKQKQAGLGDVAAAEAAKMTAAQRRVVQSLEQQATRIGMTREQWLQYKIITQTTGETQAALLQRLKANTAEVQKQGTELKKTGIEFNKYGLSAKQQVAALRQVPAQITDIFVSLQGGQNPLTVLLQQGGQLKDVFGGVVPAVRALGGALVSLINPLTVALALLGGIGFAYLSGEARANEFNRALILTGQQSRTTADDLGAIALRLDDIAGVTARQASSALTQVASSGRIAASQYELVTQAAVAMEDAVGKAVSDTVQEYADLARDPVNAVLRLNETEQFLTASVYERIRAMQEAGDIEGAAALATETRAASQIQRAAQVVESLGLVSGAWHSVKENTGEAWDAAVNYFAQLDKDAKKAAGTLSNLWSAFRTGGVGSAFGIQAALSPAAATPVATEERKINSEAQRQLDALIAGNRTREQAQALEITRIRNLGKEAGLTAAKIDELVVASNKAYEASKPKDRSAAEARTLANASSSAVIQAIKDQEELQRSEIQNTSKILQAEYGARLVTQTDYYSKQRDLVQRDFAAQEASLTKQIEHLRSRDVAGKDSINVSKQLGELESKLAKVRADGATQLVILGIQEADVAAKRKRALDGYRESLTTANEAAQRSADASLARIILGEREAAQQERIAQVLADSAEKQRQLNREFAETNDALAYQDKLSALQEYTDTQVRIIEEGYARMREAEGDWLNGFRSGLANWMEGARDVASQTNRIITNSLDRSVDALTEFATTGKLQWKSFLADIFTEISKFMMKQAVLQFAQMFLGSFTGNSNIGAVEPEAITFNAKGNVYGNSPSLSAYSGKVVSKPTPFYFAKGAGVMGEAGMEGIFPLARGADGKLGVKAMTSPMGGDVYITTNVSVQSDGSTSSDTRTAGGQAAAYRELADTMAQVAQREITKAQMPGGQLWKARVG